MTDFPVGARGLTKRFGPVAAVEDLSFDAPPGAVTGFLGPNGSGKTTTLRMILGLVAPTAGEARIGGVPFAELPEPARVVGAVLEAQGFHPARTGRRHLLSCAAAIGVPDAAVDIGLGAVGLVDAADRAVGGYSLGMKQRLALAVAMLGDPQVLILDEPGNGLDPEGIAWMRSFLRGFAARGRTVLVSSHLLGEIEQTADHLVVISRGRCVYQGGLAQLRASRRARVLVRCSDPARLARELAAAGSREIDTLPDGRLGVADADVVRVGDVALAAGVAVYGLVEETIDLEQLFFQLTTGAWRAVTGLIRAEFRKAFSIKLWWALLIPVVVLSALINLFGGLFTAALSEAHAGTGVPPILLGSLAYALTLTSIFAALYGVVTAAGEFRHRTITTTYLTAQGRGRAFAAKAVSTAAVGALYAAVTVVVGVPAGLVVGSGLSGVGALVAVTAVGLVVSALWAVLGSALGTLITNQAGALVVTLVYMLVAEALISLLLVRSDSPAVARLSAYLPGNAGDVAVFDVAARALLGDDPRLVELLAGVSQPPPWWGALLVLAAWTGAAAATAWVVGRRRDIS